MSSNAHNLSMTRDNIQCPANVNRLLSSAAGKSEERFLLHAATAAVAIETEKLWAESSFRIPH